MWGFLNAFLSNKNSNNGAPPRDPTDQLPTRQHNGTPPRDNNDQVALPNHISPSHDKDSSIDSDETNNSKLTIPHSTNDKCLFAPGMDSIYGPTPTNKKPKSRGRRSSQKAKSHGKRSRTVKKEFEWHDPEGFPTKEQIPVVAPENSASDSAAPAKRRRLDKSVLPKCGCDGPDYKFNNKINCAECGLQWDDPRDKTTMCPNCKCYFHGSCMRPLSERYSDLLCCQHCCALLNE